jgi:hypothetical protein
MYKNVLNQHLIAPVLLFLSCFLADKGKLVAMVPVSFFGNNKKERQL